MADAILPELKTCTGCKISKPLTEYGKHKLGKYGLQPRCKECRRIDGMSYIHENRERRNATSLAWFHANKEHAAKRSKSWSQENKGKVNAKSIRWRDKNRTKISEYNRQYKTENREKIAPAAKVWRTLNRDYCVVQKHKRRARERNAEGSHTQVEIRALLEAQEHRCANLHCCVDLRIEKKHLDHKQPIARGGSNGIENLQWLCGPCNQRKSSKTMEEWLDMESCRHRLAA